MNKNNIFIHIPKTGGTTINCMINKSEWQTTPDFNYRHIIYETKRSNSGDIFNPINKNKYDDFNIFMLLRNPIDRIVSEYFFIKDRPEFMSLIRPIPRDLKSYILNKQTQNYMIGFLLGKRIFDEDYVTRDDYELVVNTIKNLKIKVGIFEYYKASLSYFSSTAGVKIPSVIEVKRITLNRPKFQEISEEIKNLIIENNKLDFELYNNQKIQFENLNISPKNISFNSSKYNYIIKYTERFNLLEIGLNNKNFILRNKVYFDNLNNYLHKTLRIKDGESYVASWNASFLNYIFKNFPNSNLANKLSQIKIEHHLEKTMEICNVLNITLQSWEGSKYKKKYVFNSDDVIFLKKNKFNLIKFFKKSLFKY